MTDILAEVEADVKAAVAAAEAFFTGSVEPDLVKAETALVNVAQVWVKQFSTDFGKAALAAAVNAVSAFATQGLAGVVPLAEAAGAALVTQGLSIAESDAQTVLLNAARTALNAASIPAAAPAPAAAPSA